MRRALILGWVCAGGLFASAVAQCPSTDFTLPATACRDERLTPVNLSAPGNYSWDFCSGDFNTTPSASSSWNLPGANGRPALEFAFDGKWYAFVTGTFTNRLYRLEFDDGLASNPTSIVNLGSLSGGLNQPGPIRLVSEGGAWYGLLLNTGGELIKLSFGSSLSNTPAVSSLLSGIGYVNSGLAVGRDPVHGYVVALSDATNEVVMIRLGPALTAPNPISDVVRSAAVPNANNLGDLDLVNVCGSWHAFAVNFGNGNTYRFDFGSSLFSVPGITQLTTLSAANPGRLRIAREGKAYFFFVLSLDGSFTKVALGTTITDAPVITNEGTLGGVLASSMYGLGMAKEGSSWFIIGVNQSNGQCYRINYVDNCSASPDVSTGISPDFSYAAAGTYLVALENNNGSALGVQTQTITVTASQAPDIAFSSVGACANAMVTFTSINSSGNLTGYAWDFGDSQVSVSANPSHSYTTAGVYEPRLVVTASNGCVNSTAQSLQIFMVPVPDFTLPAASPVCTHQDYLFGNTSAFDPASNPAWEWRVNGSLLSTQSDLSTTFTTAVSQEIRLRATIPGCQVETVKTIPSVLVGPLVGFSAADDCAMNSVLFANTTTGADAGYSWDFADGSPPSTQAQPTHVYSTPGTYSVTLIAANLAGCNNSTTQDITIFSVPQPGFTVGAPPFSCSNSPTLFQNQTPPLTDSNISDWLWNFGDPGSSTSTASQPTFIYSAGGTYSVSLTATSDAGCSNTIVLPTTIGNSPVADFVSGPSCVNTPTQFSDISSGGVQSRVWQFGSTTFTNANPSFTYTSPGDYLATLTVTATGGCTHMVSKPIHVPPPPTLTLQVENPCVDQPTGFTLVDAILPPINDPVNSWQWNIGGTSITGNPAAVTVSLPGATPVSVVTAHASGCTYLHAYNTVIHPSPVADFLALPDRGDAPLTVQFQNLSSGGTQNQWLFSGTPPGFSSQPSPIYTFLELGDYTATLTVTNADGCADTKSIPIQVLVPSIDLELIAFSINPDGTTGKLKPSVTLRNGSNIPVSALEIAIHLSDKATVSEAIVETLQPGESKSMTLAMTFDPSQFSVAFVCAEVISEKDADVADNRQCISWDASAYVFDPYPNPSGGLVYVDWVSASSEPVSVTIYNAQGRKEYAWETAGTAGLNQTVHDLSFLAAGVYFVSVQTASTLQTRRIVRQ